MPSAFRDPKTLTEWIQLDYFRRPRGLRRWRTWLGWGTFLACLAVVPVVFLLPRGKNNFQAGPVSSAHAFFNDDCGKCHTDAFRTAQRLWSVGGGPVHAVPDQACTRCHDGPPHNDKQRTPRGCAECHREHRGAASLARLTDDHCTACHADLKANSLAPESTAYENVSAFPARHPEFRIWRDAVKDPGELYFNHKVHLKSAGVLGPGGKPEVLKCTDCHKTDDAGRYMQPIKYENHCARCHVLAVRLGGSFPDDKVKAAAEEFAKIPAPHKEPAVVRAVLRDRLVRFAQENPVVPTEARPARGIPRPRRLEAVSERQWDWAKRQLSESEKRIFANAQLPENEGQMFDQAAGCAYCHVPETPRGAVPRGPDDLPKYRPTQLPSRWLTHSRFRHDSHRMLGCTECHAAPDSGKTVDVLMPKLEQCANCHNAKTGVRSDCVECHGYHHRGDDYQASKGLTIAESLGK
jgi:hypothetical protein